MGCLEVVAMDVLPAPAWLGDEARAGVARLGHPVHGQAVDEARDPTPKAEKGWVGPPPRTMSAWHRDCPARAGLKWLTPHNDHTTAQCWPKPLRPMYSDAWGIPVNRRPQTSDMDEATPARLHGPGSSRYKHAIWAWRAPTPRAGWGGPCAPTISLAGAKQPRHRHCPAVP